MNDWNKLLAKGAIKHIEPEKVYSHNEIIKLKLIPWCKTEVTLTRIKDRGSLASTLNRKGKDPRGNRWGVKGSDIINYLKTYSGLK